MRHIYFATSSEAKFKEASEYMASHAPDVTLDHYAVDIPEVQSDDPADILRQKVEHVSSLTTRPFIVDDASFDTDRYPGFPGSYAKFINSTLGKEGMQRLFEDGDNIRAIARIALCYLGEIQYFDGQLDGSLQFGNQNENDSRLMSIIMEVAPGVNLGDALSDSEFENHRKIALSKLTAWVGGRNVNDTDQKVVVSDRWTERSGGWAEVIEDTDSYVNFENNYARVNQMISEYGPLVSGDALEIGCGSGEAGRILKQSNPELNILSTDIAEGMLQEAQTQTQAAGLDIKYEKVDVVKDDLGEDKYGMVLSRGVVISHLPRGDVYDFLESVTRSSKHGGYFLFDFIQSVGVGDVDKPVDTKNEFTLAQLDRILAELGWSRVDDSGTDDMRVRVVCYKNERITDS